MLTLPGLIDIGTPLSAGETWQSVSSAGLAGGFTILILGGKDSEPPEMLKASLEHASENAVCDFAGLASATGENVRNANEFSAYAAGFLLDFTQTTSDPMLLTAAAFRSWRSPLPICVRGTAEQIGAALFTANMHQQNVHVCDITRADQLETILEAKQSGISVSCDVALHTLFLSQKHLNKIPAEVRAMLPEFGTESDRAAIWREINWIDCFTSAPFESRYPALETALPLLLYLVQGGFLTIDDVIQRCHTNPKRIFQLADQPQTEIEVDETAIRQTDPAVFQSALKQSPYQGMQLPGVVRRVTLRGETVFENGVIRAYPGSGKAIQLISKGTDQ